MLSRCQKEEYSCGRDHCRLHSIYEKVSQNVRRELDGYTFDVICGLTEFPSSEGCGCAESGGEKGEKCRECACDGG